MPREPKRRIALVAACPFPTSQGSQVFIDQLATALAEAGHEVHLVTYGYGEAKRQRPYAIHRITRRVPERGLRAGPSVWKPLLDSLLALLLVRVCAKHRIEIVHAVNYEAAAVGILARVLTRLPVLYHAHGILELELPNYFHSHTARRVAARLGRWIEKRLARGADGIVALNDHDAAWLSRIVSKSERVGVVRPAIALPETIEVENGEEERGDAVFVYAGNLDRYQGLDPVLAAFASVTERIPAARLVVTTASDAARLSTNARALGIGGRVVVHPGLSFPETARIIASATAALVPRTVPYGFPIKLLNCLSLGAPTIVCQRYDGLEHGKHVLVADGGGTPLQEAMVRLANDSALRDALSGNAVDAARELYEWGRAVSQIEMVYARLVARRT